MSATDVANYDASVILGKISTAAIESGLTHWKESGAAWQETIRVLKEALVSAALVDPTSAEWGVLFEYEVPRRPVRIDVVVLTRAAVVVIEVKAFADSADRAALMQVTDYALDLRDFHRESQGRAIIPVVLATAGPSGTDARTLPGSSVTVHCIADGESLTNLLIDAGKIDDHLKPIHLSQWDQSDYRPTPDILTAARELYAGHDVRELSASYADNLSLTVDAIHAAVDEARAKGEHVILFVTGVPGSGKTLAGLSAVHQWSSSDDPDESHLSTDVGAYLSGNGPLVEVLRYALAKDLHRRTGLALAEAERRARTFIQPVHLFIREYAEEGKTPPDNLIVFDEAQRAWSEERMAAKQGIEASEASVLLRAMGRRPDWAVVVALVGQGQEINTGEAGLGAWAEALKEAPAWSVRIAPDVTSVFEGLPEPCTEVGALHLSVNVRAPRARAIADWADHVVTGDFRAARRSVALFPDYPILMTRDLTALRSYLRDRAGSDRRPGLLASSQARRLRPFGIEMDSAFQGGINWPRWFVDGDDDVRSSYQLEVAASEFKCQGLEIDWAGLCWGEDFTWDSELNQWRAKKLRGSAWMNTSPVFAINRYRVLLTRARYGLVIWVPKSTGLELMVDGQALDHTAAALLEAGALPLA